MSTSESFIAVAVLSFILLCLLCERLEGGERQYPKNYKKATERQFQEAHHWGRMEYRLDDGTRVDDLTRDHAIEYDFANKWAEAVGQALHYSRMTDKKPGIVLILRKPDDLQYLKRIQALKLGIDLWTVRNLKEPPQRVE